MGATTGIAWTDSTWTPIRARSKHFDFGANSPPGGRVRVGWHCEPVSEACRNCYAEDLNMRLGTGLAYKPGNRADVDIVLDEKMLTAPLRWRKGRRIFVCSMTDLFGRFVPDEFIDKMFAVMALTPRHTYQILTKRPERMPAYFLGAAARWKIGRASCRERV